MDNIFEVLKVSLLRACIGVFILFISTQSFAACEAEYQEVQKLNKTIDLICEKLNDDEACRRHNRLIPSIEELKTKVNDNYQNIDSINKRIIHVEKLVLNTNETLSHITEDDFKKNRFLLSKSNLNLHICVLKSVRTRYEVKNQNQNRKPQTVSTGPVSVTLTPNNSPISKCYDIAFENRSDKHVDFFIKLILKNNKTGEKGTSDWIGSDTRFDGLFGSANVNRLPPRSRTHPNLSPTGLFHSNWTDRFAFRDPPLDFYGFSSVLVESCDDITAELAAGGLRWNVNAYQRHLDACSSPIKRNRPVGC